MEKLDPAPNPGPAKSLEDREAEVLSKATARAADHLGIPNAALARILGLSEASISRLKRGKFQLRRGDKAFELALLFVRLFRGLDSLTGSDDRASRSWLMNPNLALNGARPIELIRTVQGLVETIEYVDSRRAVL